MSSYTVISIVKKKKFNQQNKREQWGRKKKIVVENDDCKLIFTFSLMSHFTNLKSSASSSAVAFL